MMAMQKAEELQDVAMKTGQAVTELFDKATYYSGAVAGFIVRGCRTLMGSRVFTNWGAGKVRVVHLLKNENALTEPEKAEVYQNIGRDLIKLLKEDTGSRDLSIIDISLYDY